MEIQPAFEVTRVDSMQWNRTALNFQAVDEVSSVGHAGGAQLPPEVIAQLREAIDFESAL